MDCISGGAQFPKLERESVVTMGSFDGLHKGHQKLIEKAVNLSKSKGLSSIVYTFDPHPMKILRPDQPFHRLFSLEDLKNQLPRYGIDFLVIETFDAQLACQKAADFVRSSLIQQLGMGELVVGYDFKIGSDRQDFESLKDKFNHIGFHPVDAVKDDNNQIISSSVIRKYILKGDVTNANDCLGRSYYIQKEVSYGEGRGQKIGIPTMNFKGPFHLLPRFGVYATRALIRGKSYRSVTNVGVRPTFENSKEMIENVETHVFDFNESVYGQSVIIEFVDFIRDEKKFDSVDSLVKQINSDIVIAKDKLGDHV